MHILIVGAGVIGLSHGWLLSRAPATPEVTLLARPHRAEQLRAGVRMRLARPSRRQGRGLEGTWVPRVVTEPVPADLVVVAVSRTRLHEVLPVLAPAAGAAPVLLMLNHWDVTAEVGRWLPREQYLLGFPGQVGGGRSSQRGREEVRAVLFSLGTVLESGLPGQRGHRERLARVERLLSGAGLSVRRERDMPGWLAVHYLQQSVTLGPLLEAGGYDALVADREALRRMVRALREGVAVCQARGIATTRISPVPLLRLPAPLVAGALGHVLAQPLTRGMVLSHMAHGRAEWEAGLREVAATGRRLGVPMPVWGSYLELLGTGT